MAEEVEVIKLKIEGNYKTHSVKSNKAVDVTFQLPYSELINYIKSLQMLNENVTVAGKIGADKKPIKLGTFMIKNLNIDNDGEGKLKLNSLLDHIDSGNLNEIAERSDEPLMLLLKAEVENEQFEQQELIED